MHVLYLTKDLFFSSRVCSLARDAGATIDIVASIDSYCATGDTTVAIVDLSLPQLDIAATVDKLREVARNAKIIAYGPHVDTAKLSAAKQAGCDAVLPRSQFDQQIAAILRHPKP
ncbi:MAG: response regulator transcription factor [Planctomycetia bacterium]|nr:response regulator transcription factor [Planctomycetia bacterium]